MAPSERHFSRIGAVAAFVGILIYAAAAMLHPGIPPHETVAAFTSYAAAEHWALIHLLELLGILLMTAAAIALAWRLRRGNAGVWAVLGAAAMVVCASVYAVFTAVDGVALGIMVDRWVAADAGQRAVVYETAFAVRQIEAGLFSLQWLMFGVAAALFAVAFFASARAPLRPGWLSGIGWLSVLASAGTLAFAVVQAQTGFTETSMAFQTGLYVGAAWIVAVGAFLYRHPEHSDALDELTHPASGAHDVASDARARRAAHPPHSPARRGPRG